MALIHCSECGKEISNLQIGVKSQIAAFHVFSLQTKTCTANRPVKIRFLQVWGFAALWRCGGRHHQTMPFRHGCCCQPYINANPYATWSL